jgi:hypothetical protein
MSREQASVSSGIGDCARPVPLATILLYGHARAGAAAVKLLDCEPGSQVQSRGPFQVGGRPTVEAFPNCDVGACPRPSVLLPEVIDFGQTLRTFALAAPGGRANLLPKPTDRFETRASVRISMLI